jgi:hypothetical protein
LQEALNAVRKAELRKGLGRLRETLSGKKFVLLARRSRVRGHAREAVDAILAPVPDSRRPTGSRSPAATSGSTPTWEYTYKGCTQRFWEAWKAQLNGSHLTPYRCFVRMIELTSMGSLAYCGKKVSLATSSRAISRPTTSFAGPTATGTSST